MALPVAPCQGGPTRGQGGCQRTDVRRSSGFSGFWSLGGAKAVRQKPTLKVISTFTSQDARFKQANTPSPSQSKSLSASIVPAVPSETPSLPPGINLEGCFVSPPRLRPASASPPQPSIRNSTSPLAFSEISPSARHLGQQPSVRDTGPR